jgi:CRISPR-associated protein Cmr2
MDKVLGIFQIGPVQEFISRSRKTQDFWASSFLLSYLISKAIEKVIEKGGKLIYPYTNTENLSSLLQNTCTPIIPNRFVVELDKNKAVEALQEAEKSVKTELLNIANPIKLTQYPILLHILMKYSKDKLKDFLKFIG